MGKKKNKEIINIEQQERTICSLYVPESAIELAQLSPEAVNAWKDLEERKLYINSEVTTELIDYVGYYILHYNEIDDLQGLTVEDRIPIKLYINTYGGDGQSALYICDLMKNSKTPVWTYGQAYSWSAGGYILACGARRFCWKHSTYLLHSGELKSDGKLDAVVDTIKFIINVEEDVRQIVLENTKITADMYDKNYRRQWFMRSEEMLELGIVDEIIGGTK